MWNFLYLTNGLLQCYCDIIAKITSRMLQDYCNNIGRIPWEYCDITVRIWDSWDSCKTLMEVLWDSSSIR